MGVGGGMGDKVQKKNSPKGKFNEKNKKFLHAN